MKAGNGAVKSLIRGGAGRRVAAVAASEASNTLWVSRRIYATAASVSLACDVRSPISLAALLATNEMQEIARGANTTVYGSDNFPFVLRVVNDPERCQKEVVGVDCPLIQKPIFRYSAGYDFGGVPIEYELSTRLNTKDVTKEHVKELCYKLFKDYGLLFWDNKPANVGLDGDGNALVLDSGAVKELEPGEKPEFLCPENSGYNPLLKAWSCEVEGLSTKWTSLALANPDFAISRLPF